jgi:hypothetical protein
MNRVWDYVGFAVWFTGLGYIVMWLLCSSDYFVLPPSLQAVGVTSAMLVPIRLLMRAVGRRRHAAANTVPPRKPAAVLRPRRRKPAQPLRSVKPRSHFGLRGVPD